MSQEHLAVRIIEVFLALALLACLFAAGRHIYVRLPRAPESVVSADTAESELTIVVRNAASPADTRIEVYPIDYATVEHNFLMSGRPGNTFEQFLGEQLKTVPPVRVSAGRDGVAVAHLNSGNWWMRATSSFATGEVLEWRMPLTISRPAHTIELSPDNAYERTKKF